MDLCLKGKIAVVAAGSDGIGKAIAKNLAQEGVRVSFCGLTPDHVSATSRELGSEHLGQTCDLRDQNQIKKWITITKEKLGVPSIAITNMGGPPAKTLTEATIDDWYDSFNSLLMVAVHLSMEVLPDMKKQKWGRIVHLTSAVAKDPSPLLPISSSIRSSISSLCRLQAKEFGQFGININCVLPGRTETERSKQIIHKKSKMNHSSYEDEYQKTCSEVPLRRLADPNEIANVVTFLASEKASFVNGSVIVVDGGVSRGLG